MHEFFKIFSSATEYWAEESLFQNCEVHGFWCYDGALSECSNSLKILSRAPLYKSDELST